MLKLNLTIKDVITGEITHTFTDEFIDLDKAYQWAHRQGVVGHEVLEVVSPAFAILENSHNGHRCSLSIKPA